MSFDVFLVRFQNGDCVAKRPAILGELRAATEACLPRNLPNVRIEAGEKPDSFTILLDGDAAFVHEAHVGFFLHGVPDWVYPLMYALAEVGDMVILPTGSDEVGCLVLRKDQYEHLPEQFRERCFLCDSPTRLAQLLLPGITGAEEYRQYILQKYANEPPPSGSSSPSSPQRSPTN